MEKMKTLKAKRIKISDKESDNGRVKYYKLNHKITKGKDSSGTEINIKEDIDLYGGKFKPEYEYLKEELKEGVDIIVISDSFTHYERLVFVGFKSKINGRHGFMSCCIGGTSTMLTNGGDRSTMKEPEVYLRNLAKQNGFEFGGIEE